MKCQDFQELIDSYLCDELLTETNHEVLRHLEQCANCRSVIEERRIFRARLRSAVQNCEEHKICEKFKANLQNSLRQSILPRTQAKKSFFTANYSWAAVAASFLIVAVLGIWFFQKSNVNVPTDIAKTDENYQSASLQKVALGDHKNCAVKHNLKETPVEINLSSPQYASLKEGVLIPLKKEFGSCEFVESHICKYEGYSFTHLVFDYEGKTMSILMLDLKDNKSLENKYIDKLSDEGYQIAHFYVDKKAVFVISDLPEQKNTAAAEVLETPLRRQFSGNQQASLISFADYRY
jgi:hypothetical protein